MRSAPRTTRGAGAERAAACASNSVSKADHLTSATPPFDGSRTTPRVTVNDERFIAESLVVEALADVYRVSPLAAVHVARMCDEKLDPTGRLLGVVREAADV